MAGTLLSAFSTWASCWPLKATGSPEARGLLCLVAAEALLVASSLFVQHGLSLRPIASVGVMELRPEARAWLEKDKGVETEEGRHFLLCWLYSQVICSD